MLIEIEEGVTRFGSWTAADTGTHIKEDGNRYLTVVCDCGIEKDVRIYALLNGGSTQCIECKRAAQGDKLRKPDSAWNAHYHRYRNNAKNRGLEFGLNETEFRKICSQNCWYCDSPPRENYFNRGRVLIANGVDRVDSKRGYFEGNCVPACSTCNNMKWTLSEKEFMEHIKKIYEFGLKK